jgi:hypothetical protein
MLALGVVKVQPGANAGNYTVDIGNAICSVEPTGRRETGAP